MGFSAWWTGSCGVEDGVGGRGSETENWMRER